MSLTAAVRRYAADSGMHAELHRRRLKAFLEQKKLYAFAIEGCDCKRRVASKRRYAEEDVFYHDTSLVILAVI